jgi:hypothetical protein
MEREHRREMRLRRGKQERGKGKAMETLRGKWRERTE